LFTGRTMHALRFAVAAGRRMANRWRASCSLTRAAVDLTGRTDRTSNHRPFGAFRRHPISIC
jgi:hypothetical protein